MNDRGEGRGGRGGPPQTRHPLRRFDDSSIIIVDWILGAAGRQSEQNESEATACRAWGRDQHSRAHKYSTPFFVQI